MPTAEGRAPTQFRRTFGVWFCSLMALFMALNLVGVFPHNGKVHRIGFPCATVEWIQIGEYRGETEFRPSAIVMNVAVSLGVSAGLAFICASARAHKDRRVRRQSVSVRVTESRPDKDN
jgi:hypothetical protein